MQTSGQRLPRLLEKDLKDGIILAGGGEAAEDSRCEAVWRVFLSSPAAECRPATLFPLLRQGNTNMSLLRYMRGLPSFCNDKAELLAA